ncbi:MAG: condensation domain-containing protein, partial [Acidobacteriota bacterium]|nr:condensation domain-containing protein [Acidobacteriota bacterium]
LARELGLDTDSPDFTCEHREMLLDHAFNRFFESSALFGTPKTCLAMVDRLKGIGVDEIGCLIDFGVPLESALEGLNQLNALRELSNAGMPDDYGFASQVDRFKVRNLQCTPSMMRLLLADRRARRALGDIETILMGGEALPESLLTELRGVTRAETFNMYGPTETTIWSAVETVTQPPITIGTPIANTSIQILDRNGRMRPIGSPGELYIGGEGVTRGYLNRPRLTAERFVPDPFNGSGARLYRTGDLACWRKDGRIDFLGRIDHQVKLRGYRIELGEIEAALTHLASIDSAAVLIRGTRPVAFATGNLGDPGDLRDALLQRLPAYMVPADFIQLDAMPLTTAGKIDRKALAHLETKAATADTPVAAPQNEEEEQIAAVWKELLEVETVSIHQSFFEMGGHSLLLARAHARLQTLFGDDLTMVTLFRYPTIHGLAEFIRARGERTAAPPAGRRKPKHRNPPAVDEPIAVIGLACRFPGAENEAAFWQNLAEGKEAITFLTDNQLRDAGIDSETIGNPNYVKAAAMLEGAETFDAAFFGFTPREAQLLDPQHRVFLELAWHALENAGYDPGTTPDRIGVFAGAGMNTYLLNNLIPNRARLNADNFQVMVTNDKDFLPTRTAYKLGLKGPAISIQTGCSTSLVAVDQACENLRTGKCEMALAGGVAVRSPQAEGYPYQEGMIASPDGHTRPFDAAGSGTLFGSGAGVVVLKPLKAALADGDHIQAVLRGSAVNNDGTDKISYTAPGIEGQATVIGEAMRRAGVRAREIDYVEAHGTGTELGDPIELAALNQAWYLNGGSGETVALGSVKSNMGHLDTAAGIAGLIKVVLSLKHGLLPPSLHFRKPNPKIDFGPFQVNAGARPWPRGERPRLAGVSSFGIGGTNAHAVVAEAPEPKPSETRRRMFLLPISARNNRALDQLTSRLAAFIEKRPDLSPADIAYTLQMGRASLTHRRIATAGHCSEVVKALRLSQETPAHQPLTNPDVVFLFPGGGTQYPNMGRSLYQSEPVYRDIIDKCALILRAHLDLDIRDLLFPEPGSETAAAEKLSAARNQPAIIFTAGYAMARLCLSWNICPKALLGHSNGEYTAACLAGVMSLEDALAMTAYRGLVFEEAGAGGMLAVEAAEETLLPFLTPDLTVAAVNGPTRCTASGPAHSIDALEARLADAGIDYQRLSIPMAGHSSLLDPVMNRFRDFVAQRHLQAPELPYISCVTGAWISDEEATSPDYWVRQMRHTVRFSDGLELLASHHNRIFLEMGPGQALTGLVRRHPAFDEEGHAAVGAMHHPRDEHTDAEAALEALGQLWLSGYRVDWRAYHHGEQRYRVPLPGYPFQRKRYWIEAVPMTTQSSMEPIAIETVEVDDIQEDGPLSKTERRLVAIWREVLGIGRIGVNDHFFMLGGDSLLVTRVHARLGKVFDSAPPIKELFEHPILAELARRIDQGVDGVVLDAIPKIGRETAPPLSFSQQRLWFLDQLEGAGATYNMKESLHLIGPIATVALERALDTLIQRHETLRTGFPADNGKPRQQILDTWQAAVTTIDLSALPAHQRDDVAAHIANREALRPYDLTQPPLIRLTLLRLAAEEHLLVVTKHHIISDGWSIGVAIRDLTALYEAYRNDQPNPLPPLPIQYADYAGWQIKRMDSLSDQQAWWVAHLTGAPALLELPTDRPRPPIQSFSGAKTYFNLDGDLLEKLTQLGQARDATLFMVLHVGFALLLSRYSGQHDICVGTPVAGRNRAELEPLIGFFINSLVLRTDLSGRIDFHQLLARVREESLGAFDNQELPFDRLVEVLQPERSLSHTPLFQVMFILQNADMALRDLPEVSLESKPVAHDTAMFDLTLFIEEKNNRLECAFEYNTDL